jgi:hypothetical protein
MENYNTYAANISKPITLDFLINQEIISHQQAAQIAFEQFQILNYQAEDLLYWRALEPKNATKSVTTKLNKLLSSAGLKKSGKFRLSDLVRDEALQRQLHSVNLCGFGLYFYSNVGGAEDEGIYRLIHHVVDLDAKDFDGDKNAALEIINKFKMSPALIWETRNGYQVGFPKRRFIFAARTRLQQEKRRLCAEHRIRPSKFFETEIGRNCNERYIQDCAKDPSLRAAKEGRREKISEWQQLQFLLINALNGDKRAASPANLFRIAGYYHAQFNPNTGRIEMFPVTLIRSERDLKFTRKQIETFGKNEHSQRKTAPRTAANRPQQTKNLNEQAESSRRQTETIQHIRELEFASVRTLEQYPLEKICSGCQIPDGEGRNDALTAIGGKMWSLGWDKNNFERDLQTINQARV